MRTGIFAVVAALEHLPQLFGKISAKIPEGQFAAPVNAVHIMMISSPDIDEMSDDQLSAHLSKFLGSQSADLNRRSVRRVSFFVGRTRGGKSAMPLVITFRSRTGFTEDRLFRHIEAPHAFHLDLPRLSNFSITLEEGIQTASGNVHLYKAIPLTGKGARRFFARLVSFTAEVQSNDVESLYVEALDHLSLVLGKEDTVSKSVGGNKPAANHVYVNVVSLDTVVQPDSYETLLRVLCTKYSHKMIRLGITTVELKLTCRLSQDSEPMFMRLVASNPTGFVLNIDKYYEALVGGRTVYKSMNRGNPGPLDELDTNTPYEVSQKFENQRAAAMAASETLYCYDWPLLFESIAEKNWMEYLTAQTVRGASTALSVRPKRPMTPVYPASDDSNCAPPNFFTCTELVLCDPETKLPLGAGWTARDAEARAVLLPVKRAPGLNDVGMVAWHVQMTSPEAPRGRDFVIICNDITFQAGSFGTREDIVFYKVELQLTEIIQSSAGFTCKFFSHTSTRRPSIPESAALRGCS
jgi:acetyl-CoA carboxylase/biotin carboxylase 1